MMVKSSAVFPRACEEITDCDKIMQLDSADSCCLPVCYVPRPEHPTLSNLQITNTLLRNHSSSQALSTLILSESIIYLVITGNCEGRPHFNVTETQTHIEHLVFMTKRSHLMNWTESFHKWQIILSAEYPDIFDFVLFQRFCSEIKLNYVSLPLGSLFLTFVNLAWNVWRYFFHFQCIIYFLQTSLDAYVS